jgi:hypothetical protein
MKSGRIQARGTIIAAIIGAITLVLVTLVTLAIRGYGEAEESSAVDNEINIAVNDFSRFAEKARESGQLRESYSGRRITWGGYLYGKPVKVPESRTESLVLTLAPTPKESNPSYLFCIFPKEAEEHLMALAHGQRIIVSGTYENSEERYLNLEGEPIGLLWDCKLEKVGPLKD